jgi:hypothetical protein
MHLGGMSELVRRQDFPQVISSDLMVGMVQ